MTGKPDEEHLLALESDLEHLVNANIYDGLNRISRAMLNSSRSTND